MGALMRLPAGGHSAASTGSTLARRANPDSARLAQIPNTQKPSPENLNKKLNQKQHACVVNQDET